MSNKLNNVLVYGNNKSIFANIDVTWFKVSCWLETSAACFDMANRLLDASLTGREMGMPKQQLKHHSVKFYCWRRSLAVKIGRNNEAA